MDSNGMQTVCGLDCGDCVYVKEGCRGCNAEKGAPFWTQFAGVCVCPVYDCCVNENHIAHCGLCEQMPCPRFTQIKEPNVTEEQEWECLKARVAVLKRRAKVR
ncbi:MAG: DUF3795 domain-containing protein [Methanocella sp.]